MHVIRPVKTESLGGLFWEKKYRLLEQPHGRSDRGPTDPSADGFPPQGHSISAGTIRPPWHLHHIRIYGLQTRSSGTRRCHSASQGCMQDGPAPSRTVCSVSYAATMTWKWVLACNRRRPHQRTGTHSLGGSTNVSEGPTFALCVDGP